MCDSKAIEVSIACITYNQAAYIREALDGFLMQETDFGFEIIVHDDCSTDGTIEILKEYEERYPKSIKCLYEERNRFHEHIPGGYIRGLIPPVAKGRYIAICEGDDYWIDAHKLQKQYDYMEANPNCSECSHAAIVIDADSGVEISRMGGDSMRDMRPRDIILDWNIPSASRFCRKEIMIQYAQEWDFPKVVGDFPSAIYSALKGNVHFDPAPMSVYRYCSSGSYTQSLNSFNLNKAYSNASKWVSMLRYIDQATNGEQHDALIEFSYPYISTLFQVDGKKVLDDSFIKDAFSALDAKKRAKCWLKLILLKCGFSIQASGWQDSAKRRLVRIEQ